MTGAAALLGLCGIGVALGLLVLFAAWHGRLPTTGLGARWRPRRSAVALPRAGWRWMAGGLVGLVIGLITGWPVGALLAAVAAWGLPRLVAATSVDRHATVRVEAVASWAEMLRDTLAAGAGLEQTIAATAHTAPQAIRPHIRELAVGLSGGRPLEVGLRRVLEQLADPVADLVIAALLLASRHQARHLAPLLGELAATARAQVEMRQRVQASRARMRTTVRTVVATTIIFAGGLVVLDRPFLHPYDSATGQVMLLAVGAVFAAGYVWLHRMARIAQPACFLAAEPVDSPPAEVDGAFLGQEAGR